jgi:FkbM family methyltransferase
MSCDTTSASPVKTATKTKRHKVIASAQESDEFVLLFDENSAHHRVYFHQPEEHAGRTFCWSQPISMVRMDVPTCSYRVTIDTASVRGDRCKFPFELRWNDHAIAPQTISIDHGKISFSVDQSMFVPNDEQRLTISCRPLSSSVDDRQLGLPIASIQLTPNTIVQAGRVSRDQLGHWMKERSIGGFRHLIGKSAPSPLLPIWSMELANVSTQLLPESASTTSSNKVTDYVIVSCVEINSRHGTGILIQHLFDDFNQLTTICSKQVYNGERVQSGLHHDLPNAKLDRHEIYANVLKWFRKSPPKRAYVVPFFDSDLIIAMAMKDLFGTKISLHFMDDQNIYGEEISDSVMREALSKADVNFAISPEMRTAYQQKYGQKIYVFPPIVPDESIQKSVDTASPAATRSKQRGILIGNIWDPQWLSRLRKTVRDSGCQIDWLCNNPNALMDDQQLSTLKDELEADGIFLQDALWGDDLIDELRSRPYALMPSGTLDKGETTESIARLSLPSRIPFMVATAQLPVIVLGSEKTAAAQFVDRFQLGRIAAYEGGQLKEAVDVIVDPQTQDSIRKNAASLGPKFSTVDMETWLWNSVEQGEPADERFESMFSIRSDEFAYYLDGQAPEDIPWALQSVWHCLKRLKSMKIHPKTIIDVGASNGVWSWTAAKVFPNAHYVMVDPLMSHYPDSVKTFYQSGINQFQLVEAALSDKPGETEFLVSDDLYGSSLLSVDENIRAVNKATVKVLTLDDLAAQNTWSGPIVLKIDVQYAEHLVLSGGANFIRDHVDALILELTVEREHPEAKTYLEMLQMMEQLGYRLVDENEGWRTPGSGVLEQKDSVFVRRNLLEQRGCCEGKTCEC